MNSDSQYIRSKLLIRLLSLLVIFTPASVFAAEYNAGAACATMGALHTKNDANGSYDLICNGTIWVNSLAHKANGWVGVGVADPIARLEVAGTISSKGGSLDLQRPVVGGGWARGMYMIPDGSTEGTGAEFLGGIGFFGTDGNPPSSMHFTHGAFPWSSTNGMTIYSTGNVAIGKLSAAVALDVVGDINYTGVIADVSDRSLKTAIHPLSNSLSKIQSLKPISFVMKDDAQNRKELGFIAQEVEEVFPELVIEVEDTKTLNYIGMIAPLIGAAQEQQSQIDGLQQRNRELLTRLDALEGAVNE